LAGEFLVVDAANENGVALLMNIQANQLSTLTPTGFERGNEIVRVRASQDNVGSLNLDIQAA